MIAICQWLLNADFPVQLRESKLSAHSLVTLRHLLNAIAEVYVSSKSEKIGGPRKVVEVDEAQLHRRKQNVERRKKEASGELNVRPRFISRR